MLRLTLFAFALIGLAGCVAGPEAASVDDIGTLSPDAVSCIPGRIRPAPDGCNQCQCSEDHTWICGQLACVNPCTPNDTRRPDDCMLCTCDAGGWRCEALCQIGSRCEPGGVWLEEDGCQECRCDDHGVPRCEPLCDGGLNDSCAPGETREEACEACECDEAGEWICVADPDCVVMPSVGCELDEDCVVTGCQRERCAAQVYEAMDSCEDDEVDPCFAPEITHCGCEAGQCRWAQTAEFLACGEEG